MRLRYVIVNVRDIDRARAFYTRFLNVQPTKIEGNRMVVFDMQNIKVGLYNPVADGKSLDNYTWGDNCHASFGVDDVESELKRVSEFAEIKSHERIDNHDWFEFNDSEGNLLEVHKI
jgi:predicted enzyme related to lactoylglutathione lyase